MNIVENPQIQPVTAGQRGIMALPVGPTYHGILFELEHGEDEDDSFEKSDINFIRFILNEGKKVFEVPGTVLQSINEYKGGAINAKKLLLMFTEHQAKDINAELAGIIGTATGVSKITVEVDIANTAVNPILTTRSIVSGPRALSNNIAALERASVFFGAAKEWDFPLPCGPGAGRMIKRIWIMNPNVSKVRLMKNSTEIMNITKSSLQFLEEEYEGITVNGILVVDCVMTNNTIPELLTTEDAQDLRLKITTTAANQSIDIYTESLADLAAL